MVDPSLPPLRTPHSALRTPDRAPRTARRGTVVPWRPDARSVLLTALAISFAAVLAPVGDWARLMGLGSLVALLLLLAGASPRWLARRLALLLPFALLVLVSVPFMAG